MSRLQAAGFVFRPNSKTLASLAEREAAMLVGRNPRDGVSVHVRHGDKARAAPTLCAVLTHHVISLGSILLYQVFEHHEKRPFRKPEWQGDLADF